MSLKLNELRNLSDEEIEARYDAATKDVGVGIDYWRDELERRRQERIIASNTRMARLSLAIAVTSTVVSIVATVIAVVTLMAST